MCQKALRPSSLTMLNICLFEMTHGRILEGLSNCAGTLLKNRKVYNLNAVAHFLVA
jgi:hypothetical protein